LGEALLFALGFLGEALDDKDCLANNVSRSAFFNVEYPDKPRALHSSRNSLTVGILFSIIIYISFEK
jgi:hypothetical protein